MKEFYYGVWTVVGLILAFVLGLSIPLLLRLGVMLR